MELGAFIIYSSDMNGYFQNSDKVLSLRLIELCMFCYASEIKEPLHLILFQAEHPH